MVFQLLGLRDQVADEAGNPLAGGQVDIFAPNTTTRITTYSDSGLTQENTNPVILTGDGRASIWLSRDADIRVNDPDGNQLYEELSINPANVGGGFNSGLLPNGSFELDTNSDGVPDGWTNDVNDPGSSNARDTGDSAAGTASWRTQSTGSGGGELVTTESFPVNDFEDLRLSFVLRSTVAAVRNIVRVEWRDSSDVLISSSDLYDSTANPSTYTQQHLIASPPSGARFARVRIIGGATGGTLAGITYWDNFRIVYPEPVLGVFDNITIQGNEIISTNTNGQIDITPDGTGALNLGGGSVVITPDTSIGGTLAVTGNTTVGGTFGATGLATFGDALTTVGAITAGTDLTGLGNGLIGGTLGVTGATTLTDSLTVGGLISGAGALTVTGLATIGGGADITGDTEVNGELLVQGGTDNTIAGVRTTVLSLLNAAATNNVNLLAGNEPAFSVGALGANHLAMDGNTLQAKNGATNAGTLNINELGGPVNIGEASANGQVVNLRHQWTDVLASQQAALQVRNLTDAAPALGGVQDVMARIVRSDGELLADLGYPSATTLNLRSYNHGATVILSGEDAGGSMRALWTGDPDGSSNLYHAGNSVLQTFTDGVEDGENRLRWDQEQETVSGYNLTINDINRVKWASVAAFGWVLNTGAFQPGDWFILGDAQTGLIASINWQTGVTVNGIAGINFSNLGAGANGPGMGILICVGTDTWLFGRMW